VSLSRPGANVTGFSDLASEFATKRLQLLQNLIPGQKLIAVLGNPDTPFTALALKQVKTAAAQIVSHLRCSKPEPSRRYLPAPRLRSNQGRRPDDLGHPLLLSAKQQIINSWRTPGCRPFTD